MQSTGQPFIGDSAYRSTYVDFSQGGVWHEKRPVYPIYTMPFNTASTYQEVYKDKGAMGEQEMKEARNKRRELMKRMRKGNVLHQDMPFDGMTTAKQFHEAKKPWEKAKMIDPWNQKVKTFTNSKQFESTTQKEYKFKKRHACEVEELRQFLKKTGNLAYGRAVKPEMVETFRSWKQQEGQVA